MTKILPVFSNIAPAALRTGNVSSFESTALREVGRFNENIFRRIPALLKKLTESPEVFVGGENQTKVSFFDVKELKSFLSQEKYEDEDEKIFSRNQYLESLALAYRKGLLIGLSKEEIQKLFHNEINPSIEEGDFTPLSRAEQGFLLDNIDLESHLPENSFFRLDPFNPNQLTHLTSSLGSNNELRELTMFNLHFDSAVQRQVPLSQGAILGLGNEIREYLLPTGTLVGGLTFPHEYKTSDWLGAQFNDIKPDYFHKLLKWIDSQVRVLRGEAYDELKISGSLTTFAINKDAGVVGLDHWGMSAGVQNRISIRGNLSHKYNERNLHIAISNSNSSSPKENSHALIKVIAPDHTRGTPTTLQLVNSEQDRHSQQSAKGLDVFTNKAYSSVFSDMQAGMNHLEQGISTRWIPAIEADSQPASSTERSVDIPEIEIDRTNEKQIRLQKALSSISVDHLRFLLTRYLGILNPQNTTPMEVKKVIREIDETFELRDVAKRKIPLSQVLDINNKGNLQTIKIKADLEEAITKQLLIAKTIFELIGTRNKNSPINIQNDIKLSQPEKASEAPPPPDKPEAKERPLVNNIPRIDVTLLPNSFANILKGNIQRLTRKDLERIIHWGIVEGRTVERIGRMTASTKAIELRDTALANLSHKKSSNIRRGTSNTSPAAIVLRYTSLIEAGQQKELHRICNLFHGGVDGLELETLHNLVGFYAQCIPSDCIVRNEQGEIAYLKEIGSLTDDHQKNSVRAMQLVLEGYQELQQPPIPYSAEEDLKRSVGVIDLRLKQLLEDAKTTEKTPKQLSSRLFELFIDLKYLSYRFDIDFEPTFNNLNDQSEVYTAFWEVFNGKGLFENEMTRLFTENQANKEKIIALASEFMTELETMLQLKQEALEPTQKKQKI